MYASEGGPTQNARSRAIANMRRKSQDGSEVRSAVKRRDSRNQLGFSSLPNSPSPSTSPRPAPRQANESDATGEFKSALARRHSRQNLSVDCSPSPSPRPSRLLRISDLPTQPEELESTPTERRRKSRLPDLENVGENMPETTSEVKSAIKRRISRQNLAECEADPSPGSPSNASMKPWKSEPAPDSSEVKSALTRRRSRHNVTDCEADGGSSSPTNRGKKFNTMPAGETEVSPDAPSEVRSAIKRRISRSQFDTDPGEAVGDSGRPDSAASVSSVGSPDEADGKDELASSSLQPSTAVPSEQVERISGFALAATQSSSGSPSRKAASQDDEPQVSGISSCQKATSSHDEVLEQLAWPGPGSGSSGSKCPAHADALEQFAFSGPADNSGSGSRKVRPLKQSSGDMTDVIPSMSRGFDDSYSSNATNACREKPASDCVQPPPSKPASLHVDASKELASNGKKEPVREGQREKELAAMKKASSIKQPVNSTGESGSPPASPSYRQRMSRAAGQVFGVLRKGL